jgi:hypothetical protein
MVPPFLTSAEYRNCQLQAPVPFTPDVENKNKQISCSRWASNPGSSITWKRSRVFNEVSSFAILVSSCVENVILVTV